MIQKLPSQDDLKEVLDYNPETGGLVWRNRSAKHFRDTKRFGAEAQANMWNGKNAGKSAFSRRNDRGYCLGVVFGAPHLAHRVIWKMVYGNEPNSVDHIDGNPSNNAIVNLRAASPVMQSRNQKTPSSNTSGRIGVSRMKSGKWKAYIGVGGGSVYLGSFAQKMDAIRARADAEMRLGFHENHGRTKQEQTAKLETTIFSFETPLAKTGSYGNMKMVEEHIKTVRSQ